MILAHLIAKRQRRTWKKERRWWSNRLRMRL